MKRSKIFRILPWAMLTMGMALMSCARAPVAGVLYSDVYYPNLATPNATGPRVGEACATSYLSLVAVGDASIEAARRNGGINQVSSVDERYQNYFIFQKTCTIVRGK